MIDWEEYRDEHGDFKLDRIIKDMKDKPGNTWSTAFTKLSIDFVKGVMIIHPIKSRQVAALTIKAAFTFANLSLNR